MLNDFEILDGLKTRLLRLLMDKFKGRPARLANKAGVGASTTRSWFDKLKAGEAVNPNAVALFKVAQACGVTVEWLLTGKEPEAKPEAQDSLEINRLREDLSSALVRIENLTNQFAEATLEGTKHARQALELSQENEKLKAQVSTRSLDPEQMADVEDIHRALGLRGPVDVSQVLHAAATSFRAVTSQSPTTSPPSDDEPDSKLKREGGQGGKAVKRRRATS